MRKSLKEYTIKFVDASVEFDKEDFEQLVGQGELESFVSDGGDVYTAKDDKFKALVQQGEDQFELNLVGLGQMVTIVGADAAVLADKRDVHEVSGKGLPVPVLINPTIDLDNKKI